MSNIIETSALADDYLADIVTASIIKGREVPITTSLKVAEVFGKEHRNVLRDIDHLRSDLSSAQFCALFAEDIYVASNGKSNPLYLMNRDGFSLLAMSFTGKKALQWKLKYIAAFNAMEGALRTKNSAETSSAPSLPDLEALKAKAAIADTIIGDEPYLGIRATAVRFGVTQSEFTNYLCDNGYIKRADPDKYWIPDDAYLESGYFIMRRRYPSARFKSFPQTYITHEGREHLYPLIVNARLAGELVRGTDNNHKAGIDRRKSEDSAAA